MPFLGRGTSQDGGKTMIGELELHYSDPSIVLPRLIGEIERDKIVPIIGRDLLIVQSFDRFDYPILYDFCYIH